MTNIIILVLASLTLISIVFAIILFTKVLNLKDELNKANKDLTKTIADSQELIEIEAGDSAIVTNYGLATKGDNPVSFTVTYEVEILEVSVDSVKVKAIDYKSQDSYAKDPANKKAIIGFLQDTWLKKHDVEMVMDNKKRRSLKLKQLGI
jgi:hypothetical protein